MLGLLGLVLEIPRSPSPRAVCVLRPVLIDGTCWGRKSFDLGEAVDGQA